MQLRTFAQRLLAVAVVLVTTALAGFGSEKVDTAALEREVEAVEKAFARSMAERDFEAFGSFLAPEAVFLGGGGTARRGKEAVTRHWQGYFEAAEAPFSWAPETVAVLASGELAISTGPVFNREGKRASTYTSTWRREASGTWRIVFDKGDRYCE